MLIGKLWTGGSFCCLQHQGRPHISRVQVLSELQDVISYTQEQVKDLMFMRELFYSKVGQLCRERKVLLSDMANENAGGENGLTEHCVRLSEIRNLAEQLCANGADQYKISMQLSCAFFQGVWSDLYFLHFRVHVACQPLFKSAVIELPNCQFTNMCVCVSSLAMTSEPHISHNIGSTQSAAAIFANTHCTEHNQCASPHQHS